MKACYNLFIGCIFILASCSPKITTQISKNYTPLTFAEEVRLYRLHENIPADAENLGTVKIGDTGFTTDCDWKVVTELAKKEARKAGGNAIKITEHIPPDPFGSKCHRISAMILKVNNFEEKTQKNRKDTILIDADYAILHVYRTNIYPPPSHYNLMLGDSLVCRVDNNCRNSIRIPYEGLFNLWAETGMKTEVPLHIVFGHEYYIRCDLTRGAFPLRPVLQVVDNMTGRYEYENSISVMSEPVKRNDIIILKDGRKIDCKVTGEDDENVYFSVIRGENEIETLFAKDKLQEIQIGQGSEVLGTPIVNYALPEKYPVFRVGLSTGFSKRVQDLGDDISSQAKQYERNLKHGFNFGAEMTYYLTKEIGIGLKYQGFNAKNLIDDARIMLYDGTQRIGEVSDHIFIHYSGPYLSYRFMDPWNRNNTFLNVGAGFLSYTDNIVMIDDFTLKGNSAGLCLDLGYDIALSDNLSLGIQLSYINGIIKKLNVSDGVNSETIELDKDSYENLSRFDFTIGIRFLQYTY